MGPSMTIMNTAVSGMLAQNNWLATISQNVANANTTGYKDAETEFAALVDQAGASSVYPGIGVSTSSLTMAAQQGGIAGTATPTDLAISGAGFFVVSDAAGDTYLTRDGSFVPDASGNLVNAGGFYLMGESAADAAAGATSLAGLQKVNVDQSAPTPQPTTAGTLSFNLPSTASVVAAASAPAGGGSATTNETSLVTYDNAGNAVTLNVYATKLANNASGQPTWEIDVYNAADAAAGGGFPYSAPALASQTLSFDPTNGQATGASSISVAIPNGQTMSLDMSGATQLASAFAVTGANVNGSPQTTLSSVSVSAYGAFSFVYANGVTTTPYVIPLANVASPDSLTAVSNTAFQANANSGAVQLATPGSSGMGTLQSSSLESSTVDIATELTSMIQAQSDYNFNSQAFQAGSDIVKALNQV
jgi:flagellar hook protein FlgE